MHETEETGLITEREARTKLCELHGAAQGKSPTHSDIRKEVEDFLWRVREQTGLFVERAPGMYSFMHLTFEEYFAARDMVSFQPEAAERIHRHRYDPRWEEPIRLVIGLERPKNATHLIRTAILAQGKEAEAAGFMPSLYEEILRRDLLLAARCIGDCTGVEPSLARDVANELVDIILNRNGKGVFQPLVDKARDMLGAVRGSLLGTEAWPLLLNAFKDELWTVREAAASALGTLGQTSPEVLQALLNTLKDEDGDVRVAAWTSLWTLMAS